MQCVLLEPVAWALLTRAAPSWTSTGIAVCVLGQRRRDAHFQPQTGAPVCVLYMQMQRLASQVAAISPN